MKSSLLLFLLLFLCGGENGLEPTPSPIVPTAAAIDDYFARFTFARLLSDRQAALCHYNHLLKEEPHHPLSSIVLLEMGSIYLEEGRFIEGLKIYEQLQKLPQETSHIEQPMVARELSQFPLGIARYEANLGYASLSRLHLEKLFLANEIDPIDYSFLILTWGDYYQAERICDRALCQNPTSLKLHLLKIDILIASQRFEEAEGICRRLIATSSINRISYLERLFTLKRIKKCHEEALHIIEELRQSVPKNPDYLLEQADTLYDLGRYNDAWSLYNHLKKEKKDGDQGYLGSGKSLLKMNHEGAREELERASKFAKTRVEACYYLAGERAFDPIFITEIMASSQTAQELNQWAECYERDGYHLPRIPLYRAMIALDENYFPAYVGLAESLSATFAFDEALFIYEEQLKRFPLNAKLLLGRARVTSWNKEYRASLNFYEELIRLNPQDPLPRLERSRVAYWGKWYTLSDKLYQGLLEFTEGHNDGMKLIHEKVAIERTINSLRWNQRTKSALRLLEREITLDPTEDFRRFEYGQALCSLGLCEQAMETYRQLLAISPGDTLARMALEREMAQENNKLSLYGTYSIEQGYGELSAVHHTEMATIFTLPLSCSERLNLSSRHWIEHTLFDGISHRASGGSLEWERRFNSCFALRLGWGCRAYHPPFGTTYSGFGAGEWNVGDRAKIRAEFSHVDEVDNTFCLQQTTQKNSYGLSLQSNLTHSCSIDTLCEYLRYSDDNSAVHASVDIGKTVTEPPYIVKIGLTGEYRNTSRTNIFIYAPDGTLENIIYPYWAPQSYFLGQFLLEWRHIYGWLDFCGAPDRFYDLKFTLGDDTNHNHFWEIKAEWHHELYAHWKLQITAYLHDSPQWKGRGIWCLCYYRF